MRFSELQVGQQFRRDVTGPVFEKIAQKILDRNLVDAMVNAKRWDAINEVYEYWYLPDLTPVILETFRRRTGEKKTRSGQ